VAAVSLARGADEWFTFLPAGSLDALVADLHLSNAQAATVLAGLSLGGIVGGFFVVAADHVDRRLLAALGALAYALAMAALGTAAGFWPLLAATFAWGAASDAFALGCEVALVDLSGPDLARDLGRVTAGRIEGTSAVRAGGAGHAGATTAVVSTVGLAGLAFPRSRAGWPTAAAWRSACGATPRWRWPSPSWSSSQGSARMPRP
jgi:MFS family permease